MPRLKGNQRVIYLDPDPNPPLVVRWPECPESHRHTPAPEGYLEWHEWAAKMTREKHRQLRCPGCQRWAIWT